MPPPPPWSPLAHNCSGKHSGMLAFCNQCGWSRHDYLAWDHPLQQRVRHAVAHYAGVDEAALPWGVDGCSAPNYALPLANLAYAFARLAGDDEDPEYGAAARTLAEAMTAHPEMVSGDGRSDLALATAGRGDFVAKVGAEGVQAIGVRSRGIGIAIKVADGAARGLHPATVAVLDQLGLLDDRQREALAPWRQPAVRNYRGAATGEVRPLVVLDNVRRTSRARMTPCDRLAARCPDFLNFARGAAVFEGMRAPCSAVRTSPAVDRSELRRCRTQRPPFGGHNNE